MNKVSIDVVMFRLNAFLPAKLSLLAKSNPEKAIELLQSWGDCSKTMQAVYDETLAALDSGDQPRNLVLQE